MVRRAFNKFRPEIKARADARLPPRGSLVAAPLGAFSSVRVHLLKITENAWDRQFERETTGVRKAGVEPRRPGMRYSRRGRLRYEIVVNAPILGGDGRGSFAGVEARAEQSFAP